MRKLRRKFCPHYLGAIDEDLRASGPNSVTDGKEIEDEGDGSKLRLKHTDPEMGMKSGDLVDGFKGTTEGVQIMSTEEPQKGLSDQGRLRSENQRKY